MSIVELIRSKTDDMTRSERQVAAYAIGHLNDVAFYTLEELAQKVQTSTTSVLRFCRRLDFPGYKQFQQAVRADLKYQPDLINKFQRTAENQVADTMLAQTVQQGIGCIQQTFRELPHDRLKEAAERIAKARRVYTFGMRESRALADYAFSRLLTARGDVFLFSEGYTGDVETILSMTKDDVFVVYLFHRYTRQTLRILELLQQRGVQVILVTSPPWEQVERYATVLLPCFVDANGIKNSFLAPICMADYLCSAVAMANGEQALRRMKQSEDLFRQGDTLIE